MMLTTIWAERAWIDGAWRRDARLELRDGLVAGWREGEAARPGDDRAGLLIPGLPNLHSHAFQRAMAGLTERRGESADSFWTWREMMYRFVDRVTPDDLQAIAAMAYAEMLECGFTRVGEFHYLHHDRGGARHADPAAMAAAIAEAARETGIGLTLLPVFYAHADFGGQPPQPAQARFINDHDEFSALVIASRRAVAALPDAVVGVAPHSLRAVTPKELAAVATLTPDAPIHIHIAEQVREVEACLAHHGARPVEWLLDHAPVDARWCLIHATHMNDAETVAMARSGAIGGLCPITEANLGDGLFPLPRFLDAGGGIGIGSDSNVRIDAWEELRLLEYGQRLAARARNVTARAAGEATGARLFAQALAGGNQALGVRGGLVVGAPADFLTLDVDHPALASRDGDALLDSMIFAAGASAVADVWRRGVRVVERGRHRHRAAIEARYRTVLARLLA